MKRTMKKALALIMALAMAMSLVVVAQAAEDEPTREITGASNLGVADADFDFSYESGIAADAKTAFLEALTAAGKDITISVTGNWDSATASGTIAGYAVTSSVTIDDDNATIAIKKDSTAFAKIVIALGGNISGTNSATVKLKGTGGAGGGGGSSSGDALTEADADNTASAISGGGFYEGYVDPEVFRVTLPTVAPADLAFTIDPQGLISATSAAAYTDKTFSTGSMYFLNTNNKMSNGSGGSFDYSPNSDKFKVVNKGACDVDVEVTVTAAGTALSGDNPTVSFVSSGGAFTGTDKSLYIALNSKKTGDDNATVAAIAKDDTSGKYQATATGTVAKTDGVYEYTWDSTNKYQYALKSGATGFKEFEFWLSGAANTGATGDWGLTTGSIGLGVTWKITKVSADDEESGPSVTATPVDALSRNLEITLTASNVTGYELKSVTYGDDNTDVGAVMGDVEDGGATITFTCDRTMANSGATAVKVIFTNTEDNTDTDPISVTIVSAS